MKQVGGIVLWCGLIPALAYAQSTDRMVPAAQFSKLIVDTESIPIEGKLRGGTACVFPRAIDKVLIKSVGTGSYDRYDGIFSDRLKVGGVPVVETARDLFAGAEGKQKGRFLVGATVLPKVMNICSSVKGVKGEITLLVKWQLFDQESHAIVESVTTEATGSVSKFLAGGYPAIWREAFQANVDALVKAGTLQNHLGGGPKT